MTHTYLPNIADDTMMEAGVKAGRTALPHIDGGVGRTQVRAIYDAMLEAHHLQVAERVTQSVLAVLKKGGDHLAIYNAVKNELVGP